MRNFLCCACSSYPLKSDFYTLQMMCRWDQKASAGKGFYLLKTVKNTYFLSFVWPRTSYLQNQFQFPKSSLWNKRKDLYSLLEPRRCWVKQHLMCILLNNIIYLSCNNTRVAEKNSFMSYWLGWQSCPDSSLACPPLSSAAIHGRSCVVLCLVLVYLRLLKLCVFL